MLDDRRVYEAWRDYGRDADLSPIGRIVGKLVGEYYDNDTNVQHCPAGVVCDRAARQISNPKHAEAVARLVESLPDGGSVANVLADIFDIRRRAIGGDLALALANGANQKQVEALIRDYQEIPSGAVPEVAGEVLDVFDVSDLATAKERPEKLIELWPRELNSRVDGGARPGHHILVFARPEAGKTLFTINLCCGFLHQGLSVLYIGNEEPAEDLRMRFRMRLLKKSKQAIRENPDKALAALSSMNLGKLKIAPLSPGTFQEITALVKEHKPNVVVLDQLRNLSVQNDSRTGQLEAAANLARSVGKQHDVLVVSITQAGDSATGKIYLALNDVDSSKTGIPAAVDLMIGIGGNEAMQSTGLMGVSLPKNKIGGDHSQFTVSYDVRTGVIS